MLIFFLQPTQSQIKRIKTTVIDFLHSVYIISFFLKKNNFNLQIQYSTKS